MKTRVFGFQIQYSVLPKFPRVCEGYPDAPLLVLDTTELCTVQLEH